MAFPHALIVDHAGDVEKGAHGYDENLLTMHGIFVATGPRFKTVMTIPDFQNINLYPLFARMLNLDPAKTIAANSNKMNASETTVFTAAAVYPNLGIKIKLAIKLNTKPAPYTKRRFFCFL